MRFFLFQISVTSAIIVSKDKLCGRGQEEVPARKSGENWKFIEVSQWREVFLLGIAGGPSVHLMIACNSAL